jgi:hypothetical protein
MDSQARVDLVLRLLQAMNDRDVAASRELTAEGFAIHYRGGIPALRGDWTGDGRTLFAAAVFGQLAGGTVRLEPGEGRAVGDRLVSLDATLTCTLDGEQRTVRTANVYVIEDGVVETVYENPNPVDPDDPLARDAERAFAAAREAFGAS